MRMSMIVTIAVVLAIAGGVRADEAVTVKATPPVVIKTVPVAGETTVDPKLKEIRVTFSKTMSTKNAWSWCMYSRDTFPAINQAGIHYMADKRTCVLPVTLQPGKTYAMWINNQKFKFFKDDGDVPAIPYLLVFQTRK